MWWGKWLNDSIIAEIAQKSAKPNWHLIAAQLHDNIKSYIRCWESKEVIVAV